MWDWSSLLSRSSLQVLSSSFSCSSRSYPATASSHSETSLTRHSRSACSFPQATTRASALTWASMVSFISFWAYCLNTPMVTCSSLSKSYIVSNCSLLCFTLSFLDLVRDFSREFHSLRRCCSTPRSSHSHWNTCCTKHNAEWVVPPRREGRSISEPGHMGAP
jgi:hypothetical protein